MNPAILNYLQAQQGQPPGEAQTSPMQQNQGQQAPYNPFDSGIRSAIESAKQSLGMTEKQQGKAFRQAMLAFAANNAQQPVQRGFFNNFGSIARSLGPAVQAHDQAEDIALRENNAMANQILAYKAAEEAKQNQAEEQAWRRQHAESQLGEQRRSHDLLDRFRRDSLESKNQEKSNKHGGHNISAQELDQTFDYINKKIDLLGDNAERGRLSRVGDKYISGGIQPNQQQAELETLGKTLEGILFNAWGYRAQAEFKALPKISSANSVETNKAIIKELRNLTKVKTGLATPDELIANDILENQQKETSSESVLMRDPETGEQEPIPANRVQEALNDGLVIVE